ncbi:hypothetical protein G4B88_021459 [Cannabis sativa]|uniref:Transmembrane protein n=1 Tax=Cannabis sativa TaxID=3483 RepID=A0A7J6DN00_CANSA|nr:hypothetical protein G4B88_021459 [Cannabis sativa]
MLLSAWNPPSEWGNYSTSFSFCFFIPFFCLDSFFEAIRMFPFHTHSHSHNTIVVIIFHIYIYVLLVGKIVDSIWLFSIVRHNGSKTGGHLLCGMEGTEDTPNMIDISKIIYKSILLQLELLKVGEEYPQITFLEFRDEPVKSVVSPTSSIRWDFVFVVDLVSLIIVLFIDKIPSLVLLIKKNHLIFDMDNNQMLDPNSVVLNDINKKKLSKNRETPNKNMDGFLDFMILHSPPPTLTTHHHHHNKFFTSKPHLKKLEQKSNQNKQQTQILNIHKKKKNHSNDHGLKRLIFVCELKEFLVVDIL